jgi:ABC-type transport system substrate-binding protein
LEENEWVGENDMGWCNPLASENIARANRSLLRQEQIDAYRIFQQEFTKDMVSLPLFNRAEIYAMNASLQGFDLRPGEPFYTWNITEWEIPGEDTITIGFNREPASLFTLVEGALAAELPSSLIEGLLYTSLDYDFQPRMQKQMSTLESGLAVNNTAMVQEGDMVADTDGYIVELKKGVEIITAQGIAVEYEKGSLVAMRQLVVKYEFVDGLIWSDGLPVTREDFELYYKIACDKNSGATSFFTCERVQHIEFSKNGYTITWIPGMQAQNYFLAPFGFYPAHRVLSDGRLLANLPTAEWQTQEEVARSPIGAGPYVLKEWKPGDQMVFEANPYYYAGPPKTKRIIIKFFDYAIDELYKIENHLLDGNVDFLGWEVLAEVTENLRAAEEAGQIHVIVMPGNILEHIDMNLYIK